MKLSTKITEQLKEIGVGTVYFFDSRAFGSHLDKSDYDIGVVFVDKRLLFQKGSDLYLKVYDILSEDIPDMINGPKLDISFLQKANPVLQMKAVREGVVLFEINPIFRADYEELVVRDYNDYLPLKKEYEETTLSAFR